VQGQSQDHDIPVASGVATISEADHATTEGWVTVKPRRKSSKKSGCSLKGKEVAVSKTGLDVNTPVTLSSPICVGTVWPISPLRPHPLVVPSCAEDVQVSSPPSVAPLVAYLSAGEARNPSPA
jgi:hypothetical protein